MASLTKSMSLFAFTSPRTIEKIIPEIELLVTEFSGKTWKGNKILQEQFFKKLFKAGCFEGSTYPESPDFAARDRITRAPKALGFIDLDPTIKITPPGKALLSRKRTHEVIARQLFKFQLPSPFHTQSKRSIYRVKPYLELLRFIYNAKSVSKYEIAIFFTQLTDFKYSDRIQKELFKFRMMLKETKSNRKALINNYFNNEVKRIFSDDIANSKFRTRESNVATLDHFVATKKRSFIDYADAFLRYLRATQLITFEERTFRAIISPTKMDEAEYILNNVSREPKKFSNIKDFKDYMYSPDVITLLSDNKPLLIGKLRKLNVTCKTTDDIETLKDIVEETEENIKKTKIEKTSRELQTYNKYDEILKIFDDIRNGIVPDAPLYLEWNIWRAVVMLNHAKYIKGNFTIDIDEIPLNTAPGNCPDIEAEYDNYGIIYEVTTSTGNKQYEMENEPVPRHYGKFKGKINSDAFCIFIAPKISEGALAHYYNLNRMDTRLYGGKTKIIPLSIDQFVRFLTAAKMKGFSNPQVLRKFLDFIVNQGILASDETIWSNKIEKTIEKWMYC